MNKMRLSFLLLATVAAMPMLAKDILVNTPNTTLLLKAEEGKPLHVSYYGEKISSVSQVYDAFSLWEEAYPAFGAGCQEITALDVKHADGNMSTELVYRSDAQQAEANATVYTVTLKDKIYDFEVDVCYRAYNNCDVIETWTVIRNNEKKPIVLQKYASGFMPFRQGDAWVTHQHGSWGAESQITEEPLKAGVFEVHDMNGAKNAVINRPNIMVSLDGKPRENEGRVVGAVLCWSGNFRMTIDTQGKRVHRLVAGINEAHSQYELKKGETFTTPELAFAYSNEGMGGVSRSYHRWARLNNKVHNGQQLRKILLNSWEGVYLNVSQDGMEKMMDGVKSLGGELFVMDDGWFGDKYQRSVDDCALGDWVTDTRKLPKGVPALEKAAADRGLKWGIWIEPEMTNTKSELYEKHPDWIVCHPTRTPITGRGGTQLILDMSNPKVQDFVFGVVDNIMKETPNTYYIKWDANFEIHNFGSHYLSADNQSHLYVDYHLGLKKTLERIRAKYPDLVIQCCASGGGRVNYGLMPYFEEFWVSDNTDAQQRLFIQWGTSMFFPSCAMAQHVSASPNHQTGRVIPLKFRFDVAMTGRLGMEMKPSDLNEKETEFARKAVQTYKDIRPIIQQGNLYRILSPYDKTGFCSEMFITDDKSEAVFFAYKFEQYVDLFRPRFHFAGLDPNATYELTELNRQGGADHWEGKRITGTFLMKQGIEIALNGQFASKVIKLKKI
ncbi:MAG: alpha-galactosidase [Bacteroidaceae bacterium]|nr:alpha-galactosidase [Bacteroidaceae bacterium]